MDNQHKHIKGYRDLSEGEIELMNVIKGFANEIGKVVELLQVTEGLDQRWISIGKTDLQKGFMALTRGVAQSESF